MKSHPREEPNPLGATFSKAAVEADLAGLCLYQDGVMVLSTLPFAQERTQSLMNECERIFRHEGLGVEELIFEFGESCAYVATRDGAILFASKESTGGRKKMIAVCQAIWQHRRPGPTPSTKVIPIQSGRSGAEGKDQRIPIADRLKAPELASSNPEPAPLEKTEAISLPVASSPSTMEAANAEEDAKRLETFRSGFVQLLGKILGHGQAEAVFEKRLAAAATPTTRRDFATLGLSTTDLIRNKVSRKAIELELEELLEKLFPS